MNVNKRIDELEQKLIGSNSKERLAVIYRDPGGIFYDKPPGAPDRRCLSAAELDDLRETFETVFTVRFESKPFTD